MDAVDADAAHGDADANADAGQSEPRQCRAPGSTQRPPTLGTTFGCGFDIEPPLSVAGKTRTASEKILENRVGALDGRGSCRCRLQPAASASVGGPASGGVFHTPPEEARPFNRPVVPFALPTVFACAAMISPAASSIAPVRRFVPREPRLWTSLRTWRHELAFSHFVPGDGKLLHDTSHACIHHQRRLRSRFMSAASIQRCSLRTFHENFARNSSRPTCGEEGKHNDIAHGYRPIPKNRIPPALKCTTEVGAIERGYRVGLVGQEAFSVTNFGPERAAEHLAAAPISRTASARSATSRCGCSASTPIPHASQPAPAS